MTQNFPLYDQIKQINFAINVIIILISKYKSLAVDDFAFTWTFFKYSGIICTLITNCLCLHFCFKVTVD